jgi:GDP-4-dehydro-6-deoxy-D-mannose reductase
VADVVLITGAGGFAGSHLLEHLAGSGDLVAWARSTPRRELMPLARWQSVDLRDREAVRAALADLQPARIYHCAGSPQVAESWDDTARPLAINALGTHHLLDAIRRLGLRTRVLVVGSALVYAASDAPLTEGDRVAPSSPYGRSKLAQEQIGLRAFADDGLDVIVTRTFNHTGPRQSPTFVAPSIARQIALMERGEIEPVLRVGNLDAQRDVTDVRDVARAYAALMEHGAAGEVYNIASGTVRTIRSVMDALIERARIAVRVETDPARLRPSDTPIIVGNRERVTRTTGWEPTIPIERTLDDLLAYWRTEVASA